MEKRLLNGCSSSEYYDICLCNYLVKVFRKAIMLNSWSHPPVCTCLVYHLSSQGNWEECCTLCATSVMPLFIMHQNAHTSEWEVLHWLYFYYFVGMQCFGIGHQKEHPAFKNQLIREVFLQQSAYVLPMVQLMLLLLIIPDSNGLPFSCWLSSFSLKRRH